MKAVKGWKTALLGELMVPKNDKAKQVKSTEYSTVGSYPIVDQSASFICGFHDDEKKLICTHLPLTIFGDHTRHTKFISFPFIAGADGTQLLKAKDALDDKFFFYSVLWAAGKIGNYGYDRHFKHLKEFHCDYPESKPEQTKIAEILSTVDRAIEQTDALIAKQQRIKTGLMQDLLTRGIDEHGNLRSEQTHQFKDSPLGRIPVEWEVEKWSQVNSKIQDGTHFSPRTDSSAEFKYVTSKNIKFGFLDLSDVEYINKKQHDKIYKRCDVCFGDVLLTKDGANTGNVAINFLNEEFSVLSSVALIRPLESKLTSMFLLQTILSESGQRLIKDAMSGLAITRVTLEIINNFFIKVPPIKEQKTIGQFLAVQDERIKSEAKKLAKFRSLKTALMQDLLTGKKRVMPMLEEAAKL